ncbi:BPSS1780 family membrane protein [Paraburkholderia acidicola]|uniref:BPSS1780 family membrane protein n=1 Tax=Paraburkholderia acidicola TaxID=1912599 RepID=A0ABV1LVI6_9BURK
MNTHSTSSTVNAVRPQRSTGFSFSGNRGVHPSRIVDWLVEGFGLVRARPLLWIAAILGCADLATLLELVPPLRLLAALVVPVIVGALVLMQERSYNARPWSIGETLEAVNGHRSALFTIGLCGMVVVGIGHLISVAAFHTAVATSMAANGVHNLSIAYGVNYGAANLLESFVTVSTIAIAAAVVWFAPALVVLRNLSPWSAMTESLQAGLRNWRVAAVYVLAIAAEVLLAPVVPPLVRGVLVTPLVAALVVLTMYGSYRDIFAGR